MIFAPRYWNAPYPDFDDKEWIIFLKCLFAIQGLIIPFTRLTEPYFYQILCSRTRAAFEEMSCCCGLAEARRKRLRAEELMNDWTFMNRDMPTLTSFSSFTSSSIDTGEGNEFRNASINSVMDTEQLTFTIKEEQETTKEKKEQEQEEAGEGLLYLELVSSLNVELVYIILKSITQFAYVKKRN